MQFFIFPADSGIANFVTFILKVTLFFIGFLKAKFRCFFINIMEFCENFVYFIDTLL